MMFKVQIVLVEHKKSCINIKVKRYEIQLVTLWVTKGAKCFYSVVLVFNSFAKILNHSISYFVFTPLYLKFKSIFVADELKNLHFSDIEKR